ncbi:hypothetical protein [Photobacterium kishitanii]|uniref:Alpha/beta hydrolase n=1 Tax=Photobacterium kishitanii TaxID=318456 RepID=A0A2T3KMQ1_9GAMM|nr:hypothetical protein [Photobacterium kishitanii]PSV01076.1 hypothetical protein C9J27_03395 [Photobacterium kishitanii]
MTIKNLFQVAIPVIFLASAMPVSAETGVKIGDTAKAVLKHVKIGNRNFDVTSYLRRPVGKYTDKDIYPSYDYFVLWHGEDQNSYEFLNVTGLGEVQTSDRRGAVFLGADMTDLNSSKDAVTYGRVINMLQGRLQEKYPQRKTMYVAYDLGVADAYHSACGLSIGNVTLSSGGLFESESCSPKNMKVMYTFNDGDNIYPVDKDVAFVGDDAYSLKDRIDANSTESKLSSLLQCNTRDATIFKAYGNIRRSYLCSNGNSLDVIEYHSSDHQWNGYKVATDGEFNQFGSPNDVKVTNWMMDIFSMS